MPAEPDRLIPPHGGYRNLKSFQVAELVYDVTVRFCDRYIDPRSRTHDQMVQAARSGVQNIAEGSQVSATSNKMEMKLTSVARASLEELRRDYEDHLRQRGMEIWRTGDPRRTDLIAQHPTTADDVAIWVKEHEKQCRRQGGQSSRSTAPTGSTSESLEAIAANAALTLVVVACSLLSRQVAAQAKAFEEQGGFTERLYRMRQQRR